MKYCLELTEAEYIRILNEGLRKLGLVKINEQAERVERHAAKKAVDDVTYLVFLEPV